MRSASYLTALRGAAYLVAAIGLLFVALSRERTVTAWMAKASLGSSSKPAYATKDWTNTVMLEDKEGEKLVGLIGSTQIVYYYAKVKLKIDYPPSVYSDEPFVVRASAMATSDFVTKVGSLSGKQKTVTDIGWNADQVQDLFDSGRLGLVLSIAGADASPKGIVLLNNGEAKWVITPSQKSSIKGFLQVQHRLNKEEQAALGVANVEDSEYSISTDESSNISIETKERLITREKVVSSIIGFFGAFLTLPGILAFLQSRRDKAEKDKRDGDAKRVIIEPPFL